MTKRSSPSEVYLCFDLGGTKLLGAHVSLTGRIIRQQKISVDLSRGPKGLIEQFVELAETLGPARIRHVAVASAGPLHSEKGLLLDPTNFSTDGQPWGVVPLVCELKTRFKKPVWLENDAAAAVLAEVWRGGHGASAAKNVVVMTLGTGVGIGVIANGQLVRSGQGLHPELSHIPLNITDTRTPCGCGAFGCIEAYLGGTHFAKKLSLVKSQTLTGHDCLNLATDGDPETLAAYADYGEHLAYAIRTLAVAFAPKVVVLSGGFVAGSPYFLKTTKKVLPRLMERYRHGVDLLPTIKISKLHQTGGLLGAAYLAKTKQDK